MPDGLVSITKIKDWTKPSIQMWSQKLNRIASFGFGTRKRLLTI